MADSSAAGAPTTEPAARYPLYREGGDEVTAWIDDDLRLRDTQGRFIPMSRDLRRAHLAACQIVEGHRLARAEAGT